MSQVTITHGADSRALDLAGPETYGDLLRRAGAPEGTFAALVDGTLRGLYEVARDGETVVPVDFEHPHGRELYRHSTAHIMA